MSANMHTAFGVHKVAVIKAASEEAIMVCVHTFGCHDIISKAIGFVCMNGH